MTKTVISKRNNGGPIVTAYQCGGTDSYEKNREQITKPFTENVSVVYLDQKDFDSLLTHSEYYRCAAQIMVEDGYWIINKDELVVN